MSQSMYETFPAFDDDDGSPSRSDVVTIVPNREEPERR